jgi:hypothetical protein
MQTQVEPLLIITAAARAAGLSVFALRRLIRAGRCDTGEGQIRFSV